MGTIEHILQRLVAYASISRDGVSNNKIMDFAENVFKPHMVVRRFLSGGSPSLVATTVRTKKPRLLFAAHTDVVPGPERLFTVRERGGKLFGRGVLDMKFAIACYLQLANEFGKRGKEYDFGIMLTSDEEVGGQNGVEYLLKKGYGADFVFLPDGGADWRIESGAKGLWHLDFEARGASAHAAYPWKGKSPVLSFLQFLQDLAHEFRAVNCDGKNHYHDTLTVSRISGGEAINQVPAHITASVDIRHVPETSKTELEKRIKKIMSTYKDVSFKERAQGNARAVDLSHPFMREYKTIAKEYGIRVGETFSHGSSDARFFAERGIPVLTIWPRGGGHHGDNEWIYAKDIEIYYRILKEWVQKVALRKEI